MANAKGDNEMKPISPMPSSIVKATPKQPKK
jgi:hypothetical protein